MESEPDARLLAADLARLENLYRQRWQEHGVSPLSLGWTKGKQDVRFDVLLAGLECEGRSFLDVGCGFGDLNKALRLRATDYQYVGIDIMEEFVAEARRSYGRDGIAFRQGNFLTESFEEVDFVIACGVFAFELTEISNYEYIERMLAKMFSQCREGVSIDFLSDRVNFQRERTFYANPGKILDIAFGLTRNVRLRHDYMPFEFSVTLFRNDRFQEHDTIFERYKHGPRDH